MMSERARRFLAGTGRADRLSTNDLAEVAVHILGNRPYGSHGDLLRELRNGYRRVWREFGEAVLMTAARRVPPGTCRWDLVHVECLLRHEPDPPVSPAYRRLLGDPCPRCLARMRQSVMDSVGPVPLRVQRKQPATVASVSPPPRGSVSVRVTDAPTGWKPYTSRPRVKPTPEQDAAFLASMETRFPYRGRRG